MTKQEESKIVVKPVVAIVIVEKKIISIFSKIEPAIKCFESFQMISNDVQLETHEVLDK